MSIEQYRILAQAKVPAGEPLENAVNEMLPVATVLRICQFDMDPGCYLLIVDASGEESTDSYHATFQDAVAHAQWEYCVDASDWEVIAQNNSDSQP